VFHQNIRGLLNKTEELISSLSPDFPQVLCLTEHHLKHFEIDFVCVDQYKLGAKFCRESFKSGGVSTFVHDTLQFTNINLDEFCKEQDIEACAVKINLLSLTICIISIYRSPMGNFLHTLDTILNFLNNNTIEIIICGDFNINYLNDNDKTNKLDNLLLSYNFYSTVNFPTRIHNNSVTSIDNILIDKVKYENYSILMLTL
jgi:exonuclease III